MLATEAEAHHQDGRVIVAPATTNVVLAPREQEDSREAPGGTGTTTAPRLPQTQSVTIISSSGTRRTIASAPALGIHATPLDSATLPTPLGSTSSNGSNNTIPAPEGAEETIPAPKEAEDVTPANITRRSGFNNTMSPIARARETPKAKG